MSPKDVPRQPQSQESVTDQLLELLAWANRLGLYDAADLVCTTVKFTKVG